MLEVAALSDIGCRRTNNEDSFGYDLHTGLFVVSDGMGGSAAGEIASHVAVEATLSRFRQMLGEPATRSEPVQHLLYFSVQHANASVYDQARQNPHYAGM
ncbi:MAG: protein phosphatase 2C domain-containing protein, partial [Terriglobus roseus]|nr:protein phosphatase 2C domain-containing protein [Terriglobus roseus]